MHGMCLCVCVWSPWGGSQTQEEEAEVGVLPVLCVPRDGVSEIVWVREKEGCSVHHPHHQRSVTTGTNRGEVGTPLNARKHQRLVASHTFQGQSQA